MEVKIANIKISENRRKVDSKKVSELANSIKEIGLINPITITTENVLVAGLHRLYACKKLGQTIIEATITTLTGLKAKLAEIDENLIRNELDAYQRGEQLKERKEIYEALYPETKHGGDRGNQYTGGKNQKVELAKPSFVDDTAQKTGRSKSTINEEIQIARDVIPEAKEILREQKVSKKDALIVSRLTPEEQKNVVKEPDKIKEKLEEIKEKIKEDKLSDDLTTDEIIKLQEEGVFKQTPGTIRLECSDKEILKVLPIFGDFLGATEKYSKAYLSARELSDEERDFLLQRLMIVEERIRSFKEMILKTKELNF